MVAATPSNPKAAARLRQALDRARDTGASAPGAGELRHQAAGSARTPPTAPQGKAAPRPIKFANPTSALRQHVEAGVKDIPPPVRIRLRPQAIAIPEGATPAAMTRAREITERIRHAPEPASVEARGAGSAEAVPIDATATLGAIVRRQRKHHLLSQQDLADLAQVGRRFVLELEAGKPSLEFERVIRVCRVLGLRLIADFGHDGR